MEITINKIIKFFKQFEENIFELNDPLKRWVFLINRNDFLHIKNIINITDPTLFVAYGTREFFQVPPKYPFINLQFEEYNYYEDIPIVYKKVVEIMLKEELLHNIDLNIFLNNYYKLEYFVKTKKIKDYQKANKNRLQTQKFLYIYLNILFYLYNKIEERIKD